MSAYDKYKEQPPVDYQPSPLGPPPAYAPPHATQGTQAAATSVGTGAGGVYVQQAVVAFQFPETPVRLTCKHCGKHIVTEVEQQCLWGRLFMCLFCSVCLIVAGFCVMSTKNCHCRATEHTCPECKRVLGMAK